MFPDVIGVGRKWRLNFVAHEGNITHLSIAVNEFFKFRCHFLKVAYSEGHTGFQGHISGFDKELFCWQLNFVTHLKTYRTNRDGGSMATKFGDFREKNTIAVVSVYKVLKCQFVCVVVIFRSLLLTRRT